MFLLWPNGGFLPAMSSRDNKPCQYRLKPTLQRHLAPDARRGITGQKTVDLNSIGMGLHSPPKYKEVIFPSFKEMGSRGSPGPRQQWGSRVESLYSLCSVSELLRATPGSTGLKLSSTTATTPDIPVTPIPMGVAGPLLEGIVGLVLGRSSLSLRGISVVPGVVDSDYTGIKLKF